MTTTPKPDHDIDPIFAKCWLAGPVVESSISESELMQLLEAARWAPSSFNYQPWRFLYAFRDTTDFNTFGDLLSDAGKNWSKFASAVILVLSDTRVMRPNADQPITSYTNAFDAGMAFGQMALQAADMGLYAHPIQDLNHGNVRRGLRLPEFLQLHCAVAVCRRAAEGQMSGRQITDGPADRLPVGDFVAAGEMPAAWASSKAK